MRSEWHCASCGRTKDQLYAAGVVAGAKPCTPTYCREQGINPSSPQHRHERETLVAQGEAYARGLGRASFGRQWEVRVFYNLGWVMHLWAAEGSLNLWPPDKRGSRSRWWCDYHSDDVAQVEAHGDTAQEAILEVRRLLLTRISFDVRAALFLEETLRA